MCYINIWTFWTSGHILDISYPQQICDPYMRTGRVSKRRRRSLLLLLLLRVKVKMASHILLYIAKLNFSVLLKKHIKIIMNNKEKYEILLWPMYRYRTKIVSRGVFCTIDSRLWWGGWGVVSHLCLGSEIELVKVGRRILCVQHCNRILIWRSGNSVLGPDPRVGQLLVGLTPARLTSQLITENAAQGHSLSCFHCHPP